MLNRRRENKSSIKSDSYQDSRDFRDKKISYKIQAKLSDSRKIRNPSLGQNRVIDPHGKLGNSSSLTAHKVSNTRSSTPKQRRRQQELMEVRVRSHYAFRQRAQRILLWLSVIVLFSVIGGSIYWAATKGFHSLFYNNPEYNISQLVVETDGVLSRNSVLSIVDIHEGTNIFHVNLDQARARLEALAEIQKVRLERQLPNKITIRITERKPIAWLAPDSITSKRREDVFQSSQSFLIDNDGVLIRPAKVLSSAYNLPIIRGFPLEHYTIGQKIDTSEMQATLGLLKVHQESIVGARFQVSDIDLSKGYGLVVTDNRSHLQVLFGLDDPRLQFQTLETLLQAIEQSGRKPATISLMTLENRQRNIPVTFFPGSENAVPVAANPPADAATAPSQSATVTEPAADTTKKIAKNISKNIPKNVATPSLANTNTPPINKTENKAAQKSLLADSSTAKSTSSRISSKKNSAKVIKTASNRRAVHLQPFN